ncbi:MAG: GNAT family N-acetyltransferase, partial [Actinomycetota bacterium]|nr:GNAT family N-acetyltransferase [Actinomycetota bacterium]
VRLAEVDVTNWFVLAEIEPNPDQRDLVAPVTRYLCLAHYGGEWHPLAIEADGSIVGHVMWAVDDADGSTWLGGLIIDAVRQGRGIGRAAVQAFLDRFTEDGKTNVALSYSPANETARKLYLTAGFVETGEMEGDEIVARYRRGRP